MTTPTRRTGAPQGLTTPVTAGVGASPLRPDGTPKVKGEFAYGSDMWVDGMIWGVTLRSPHPYARINSLGTGPALATPGVYAVLTHEDVPGSKFYGLEIVDQPVLAVNTVRYHGEPVALVAADHPEIARQAAKRIRVDYDVYEPITDAREALGHPRWNQVHNAPGKVSELSRERAVLHPQGNLVRHLKLRKGDPEAVADVVVIGEYEVGMQDQAFLGPESGLAVPAEDGGVELFVATQWLHVDQRQICAALGLPPEMVRLTLAGVGGAFGGREDLSMHIHACMLALHTGKPVKMVYNREESFFGHVHRHPAVMRFEHGASLDGTLVYVKAQIYLDGGAYASSTPAVVGNAGTMGIGPYIVPNVQIDAYGAYTNNPPCGAMRGFGSVQAAFAHEAQMDRLAAELGMDPIELRCRNAMTEGAEAPTGQVIDSAAPVEELLRRVQAMPLPPARSADGEVDLRDLPGGVANTTHGEGVVRGIGYAVAYKNVGFSEGFDDYSTARVRLEAVAGEATATVHTAAAEVGQGLVTVEQQIARTELGVQRVIVHPKDTGVGSGGSTSASRQTYVTGGAVKAACEKVRERALEVIQQRIGRSVPDLRLDGGKVVSQARGRHRRPGRPARRRRHRRDGRVAPPPDRGGRSGDRAGVRPRAVRVLGAPRGRRRGHRARPDQGRGARLRPGRRQGHQPAGGRRADPGRLGTGNGAGRDGGDPDQGRQDQEPVLHRLPHPDDPRRAPDADRRARVRRPERPIRRPGGRRAPDDLLRPGHRRRHPRRHRAAAVPGAGAARAHHRHLIRPAHEG